MHTRHDIETTAAAARALLDERVDVIRELATALGNLTELSHQITAAERARTTAYQAALSKGWTSKELARLGFTEPGRPPRQRTRTTPPTHPSEPANPTTPDA